jgi:hypothetical protein
MNAGAQKAKELFLAAVKLDSDQWDSYLRTACAENPELHSRVSALLQAHLAESSFFEAPATGGHRRILESH